MNKIAVFTGSRAEYWLLRPLIKKIQDTGQLMLIVGGEHLIGAGIEKICNDGFSIAGSAECQPEDDSFLGMAKAISCGVQNFSTTLNELKPDIVVMLGDRFEVFAAATAAYALKIPIAHIHGGEITHGAIDDGFRHSISKMSQLHFVSHEQYKQRLIRMGEQPKSVHVVGAAGLDNIDYELIKSAKFFNKYPFLSGKNYLLLTLHPTTLCDLAVEAQVASVKRALDDLNGYDILVTHANQDPGGAYINQQWQIWAEQNENVHVVSTLGDDYLAAVYHAKMVIGNSSSGILEAPYLDRPVINIGDRQNGRIIPKGVYHTDFDAEKIKEVIEKIVGSYKKSEQIYGIPGSISTHIFKILSSEISALPIQKEFYDDLA